MTWGPPLRGSYQLGPRFGAKGPRWSSGSHTGQDFQAPIGTPVYAVDDGIVTFRGDRGRLGNTVIVSHGNGLNSWYCHLNTFTVLPLLGVDKGEQVGTIGMTGNTTGPHLHLQAERRGILIDPMPLIGQPSTPDPETPTTPTPDGGIPGLEMLSDPGMWQRVGMFVGGGVLIVTGLFGARKSGVF